MGRNRKSAAAFPGRAVRSKAQSGRWFDRGVERVNGVFQFQPQIMHTLLDLRGSIPTFIHITHGKVADVNVLDVLVGEPGAFYVMDRGYVDFRRLRLLAQSLAF